MVAETPRYTDTLIIGSGLAGLWCALEASRWGQVTVVTKKERAESNTNYAQGGIAAVLAPGDHPNLHVTDTQEAGAGLCHPDVVKTVVEEGPPLVRRLVSLGVGFSTGSDGELDLGREGGHSRRRIVHAADRTGSEVERALLAAVAARPNITVLEHFFAVDLILASRMSRGSDERTEACWGAYVLTPDNAAVIPFEAKATVLASGGCGKVYRYTSNPDIATGDGLAAAFRAGARVSNLEFVQFHPTCLYHPRAPRFLITEALRGEGAVLRTLDGVAFMKDHDSRGDLAPRDIVARAIDDEMKTRGQEHVLLDATALGRTFLQERFPQVMAGCREYGIDPAETPIPVVPAAHYMCGGVRTDLQGATDIPRLYAIGEVAHTGLHGANRLASNSLLEALVFADRASRDLRRWFTGPAPPQADLWRVPSTGHPREDMIINHNWREVRRLMWDYVGIVRSRERLITAASRLALIREEVERFYRRFEVDTDILELRNITCLAEIILRLATARRESRGLHFVRDYPDRNDGEFRRDSVLGRVGGVSWGDTIQDTTAPGDADERA
jgi:L-aspartate oxidase